MDEQSFQLQSDCGQCQPQCEFFSHSINSLEILINCFDDGDDDGDAGDGDDDVHDDDDDKPGEGDSVGVGGLGGEHCREERAWGEVIFMIIISIIIINDKLGLLLMKWYLVLSMKMVFGI